MTLDELHDAFCEQRDLLVGNKRGNADAVLVFLEQRPHRLARWPQWRRLWKAAKLYCIARDEGMDAALLWKLANGGAQ